MGLLRSLIWSSLCIALGVFLGSHSFSGHTAVEHAEQAIKEGRVRPPTLDEVKENVEVVFKVAKNKLGGPDEAAPTEKHSSEDRTRVNQIIARRKP